MKLIPLSMTAFLGLAACMSPQEGDRVAPQVAIAQDTAVPNEGGAPLEGVPWAIAVLPDGCQAWIGDNGAEGYGDARLDRETGAAICSDRLPAGAIVGDYRQTSFPDILP